MASRERLSTLLVGIMAGGALVGCSDAGVGPQDAGHRSETGTDAHSGDATMNDARSSDGPVRDAGAPEADVTPPTATTLAVSLPLVPPFSTAIHDYYVRCPGDTNELRVVMTAAPGHTIALTQPITTTPAVDKTVPVSVAANAAIVAVVDGGDAGPEEYWVRCLPPGFPDLQMTPHPDAGAPTPGYYLIGNTLKIKGETGYAIALDTNGVPVWYHTTKTGTGGCDVDNVIPGTISFVPYLEYTFGNDAGEFELHDLEAGTTTYTTTVNSPLDLHELRYLLPSGDYLMVSDPVTTGVNLTGLGTFGDNEDMIGCVIQEVSPTGTLVWKWDATQHFDPVKDCTFPSTENIGTDAGATGATLADPFHCNSIDLDPTGNLLVSARNMDSVFLIDRTTTGNPVIWKMGGSTYVTDTSATYITVTNDPLTSFHRQHDARFLPNGDISMFDDETGLPGPARGVVYSYDVSAGTASMVWQYQGAASSFVMGSFRTLADGSRVIGWGLSDTPGHSFTEIGLDGGDVLDFDFPAGDVTFRAIKIPITAFDIGLLRRTAGGP